MLESAVRIAVFFLMPENKNAGSLLRLSSIHELIGGLEQ